MRDHWLSSLLFLVVSLSVVFVPWTPTWGSTPALVETEAELNTLLPYKQRQVKSSLLFSIGQTQLYPSSYVSPYDGNSYTNLFGENQTLPFSTLEFIVRQKWGWFDFGVGIHYGMGQTSSNKLGDPVSLNFSGPGLALGLWLNQIWDEPFVVPYLQYQYLQWSSEENSNLSGQRTMLMNSSAFKVGLQFQLNIFEKDLASRSLAAMGLQNTFLDIYLIQGLSKPIHQETHWGGALTLEF